MATDLREIDHHEPEQPPILRFTSDDGADPSPEQQQNNRFALVFWLYERSPELECRPDIPDEPRRQPKQGVGVERGRAVRRANRITDAPGWPRRRLA